MVVGQKVVCVDDKFRPSVAKYYFSLPKKGVTYVIRNVSVGISPEGEPGQVCLLLIGLPNPRSRKKPHLERGFNSERFRPLEEVQEENAQRVTATG